MCEGVRDSIDSVFIHRLMNSLKPGWVRPWKGSNIVRVIPCGGRRGVIEMMPEELRNCIVAGSQTTLMVWADCDDDCAGGEALREIFWQEAQNHSIDRTDFDRVVFIFAKDRIENWVEFLQDGATDELKEGRRVSGREASRAAMKLADICLSGRSLEDIPPSLQWSCGNWRALTSSMR